MLNAKKLFQDCLAVSWTNDAEMSAYCLERLGDMSRWNVPYGTTTWATVFLAHSIQSKQNLGIYKALEFLGDIFRTQGDEDTAFSLFTAALEGFTYVDVHRGRAECMLNLGDIYMGKNDFLQAVELWETAKPLFERSSQAKQVENINMRLASVQNTLGKHRK
jgi:tetratricopeptide (TPR) repeat protein